MEKLTSKHVVNKNKEKNKVSKRVMSLTLRCKSSLQRGCYTRTFSLKHKLQSKSIAFCKISTKLFLNLRCHAYATLVFNARSSNLRNESNGTSGLRVK